MKQKLQARRGATIMAALLFFLVASVCGSIILAAATATLSRITTQAEDARAYYSLTSAAQLLREDVLQSHWQVTKTISASTSTYTISALDADGTFIKDLLSDSSGEGSGSVFKNENTIQINATSEGKTLPIIYAKPVIITSSGILKLFFSSLFIRPRAMWSERQITASGRSNSPEI